MLIICNEIFRNGFSVFRKNNHVLTKLECRIFRQITAPQIQHNFLCEWSTQRERSIIHLQINLH